MSRSSPTVSAPATTHDRIGPRRLFAFMILTFGMFLSFLDIQIVSASMAEIQAGLSASSDEITWVQTSYLIADVVAVPLSGFLGRALGSRILFSVSAAGFGFASLMCGFTSSMSGMIFWRAVQGFLGGGMIPTVFASTYSVFSPSQQRIAVPLVALLATLAPTLGPTIGGYVTDTLSWQWLFFVNVGPSIAAAILTFILVDFDRPNFSLLEQFDGWGFIYMAGFLGALQYVLEEGPRWDWFNDATIRLMGMISAASGLAFIYRALQAPVPIVDLRAYANRNFAVGSLLSFVLGIGLSGLTYLYPIYLERIRGYDALMVGETMFVSGLTMFLCAPIAGRLATRSDPRLVVAAGFMIFALGPWQMMHVTKDWDFWELLWPQICRGAGVILAIVPITNVSLGTLPVERLQNASGLFNTARSLGGAVGIAALNTVLDKRIDLHLARLHEALAVGRAPVVELLTKMTTYFRNFGSDAQSMALRELMLMARQQGLVMGFSDVFLILVVLYVGFSVLPILLRRPSGTANVSGH